jgi:hypothetical protein
MLTSIIFSGQVHGSYSEEVDAKINKALEPVLGALDFSVQSYEFSN